MNVNEHLISDLVEKHGRTRVALMPILQGVVAEKNYITDSDPFAIITPLIFYYSQPERIWNLGDHLIGGTLLTYNSYQGKTAPVGLPKTIPVDFVSGCAMIINSDVIERIGMFDETLVMYGEEVDYCWRARIAGYHAVCITRSKVWHKVSKSADKNKNLVLNKKLNDKSKGKVS